MDEEEPEKPAERTKRKDLAQKQQLNPKFGVD